MALISTIHYTLVSFLNKTLSRILGYILLAAVSIAAGIFVAEKYVINRRREPQAPSLVGTRFPQELDWQKSAKTLVLALQKDCKYCSESAPFYQRLVLRSAQARVRLLAVMPDDPHEAELYLSKSNVKVAEIKQVQLRLLGIRGTPSLFLVNNIGMVEKAWEGKLSPANEQEVLAALGG